MSEIDQHAANVAQTMRDTMEQLGHIETVTLPKEIGVNTPIVVSVPTGRKVEDLSASIKAATLRHKPEYRRGTSTHITIDSLIDWANRFKGPESALFADTSNKDAPSLTCISNYHAGGEPAWDDATGAEGAAFCDHRGIYRFPVSEEWKIWQEASVTEFSRDMLAEFIDNHILHFQEPTPHILTGKGDNPAPWEERNRDIADRIGGRFGQPHQLLNLSRELVIHETSNLSIKTNRDDGTADLQFLNEHKDAEGKPLRLPNLFLITIPVFDRGDLYRLTVRFFYRKNGPSVKFRLVLYNPDAAFQDAIDTELAKAQSATALPLFRGKPEA